MAVALLKILKIIAHPSQCVLKQRRDWNPPVCHNFEHLSWLCLLKFQNFLVNFHRFKVCPCETSPEWTILLTSINKMNIVFTSDLVCLAFFGFSELKVFFLTRLQFLLDIITITLPIVYDYNHGKIC